MDDYNEELVPKRRRLKRITENSDTEAQIELPKKRAKKLKRKVEQLQMSD